MDSERERALMLSRAVMESEKDRLARKRREKKLGEAQLAEAEHARQLNRVAAQEYRARRRDRKYNASAIICRHCDVEGHNPVSLSCCHNYCRHCKTFGHATTTCEVQAAEQARYCYCNYCERGGHATDSCDASAQDETDNARTAEDAKNYKVWLTGMSTSVKLKLTVINFLTGSY
jgi:late competence protein required for DNA uptake (superfamily II DNA/RNA helicase)